MKQKLALVLSFLFILGNLCISQSNNIAKELKAKKLSVNEQTSLSIFNESNIRSVNDLDLSNEVSNAEIYNIDEAQVSSFFKDGINNELLEIELPIKNGKNLVLSLYKTDVLGDDFNVFAASNRFIPFEYQKGLYYWGIVNGDEQSIASLSFTKEGISGFIYSNHETYNLGKLNDKSDQYILVKESELKISNTLGCDVEDDIHVIGRGISSGSRVVDSNRCVQMYLEIDNDIFVQKGGMQQTTDYITAVFAQVAILYANEDINFGINEIVVWDVSDPYTGPGTDVFLNQFRANVGSTFNGDLAHLVGYQGGGGIAYVDVLCNPSYGHGYSDINSTFSIVPTYSWTVEVLTHEIGHNLGSRHTHNCVWNGNGTAIDRCGPAAGYDAQQCNSSAPIPSSGTIMSYCHLVSGVGIDFNLGFGPQPGDLIRDRVYNASCLVACAPPTADDAGITSIIDPSGNICSSTISPIVELTNFGSSDLTSVTIDYSVDGGSATSYSWTGTLTSGSSTNIALASSSVSLGSHTISAETSNPNGVTDEDNSNDGMSGPFTRQNEQTYYADTDGDGFGDPNSTVLDCNTPAGYVNNSDDCDDNDINVYIGATCDDGLVCTNNELIDANCNCVGTEMDSDNDGVCDALDICPGGDDNADADNDGIPDFCDCNAASTSFSTNPLTHSGSGSSSTSISFASGDKDVSFTVSDMGSKLNGNPNNRYDDEVTITYVDGNGSNNTYGVFTGSNQSSVSVNITGEVQSVIISLANAVNTNRSLSVNLSTVNYCSGVPPCQDDDNDGVCNDVDQCPGQDDGLIGQSCNDSDACTINDVYDATCGCSGTYSGDSDGDGVCDAEDICPGGDDNADADGDGIPDFCDGNCDVTTTAFNTSPLEHQGSGSSSETVNFSSGNVDAAFTISGLNAKTNGNPNGRYIERATVEYVDGNGSTVVEGVYNGDVQSSASITITGIVQSVTVTLEDGYDGNAGNRVLSVDLSDVTSCVPAGSTYNDSNGINSISVFPNPAKDRLFVQLSEVVDQAQITIYNAIGNVLGEFEIKDGKVIALDLNEIEIQDGFILVSIKEEGAKPTIKKVIVMK
jgi:hypothetical protein